VYAVVVAALEAEASLHFFSERIRARSFAEDGIKEGAREIDIYEIRGTDDPYQARVALELGRALWRETKRPGVERRGQVGDARQ
jgi:hypothetical protein